MLSVADCTQALQAPLMQQIIRVESSGNPFAIGVVGNQLVRQPRNLPEAVATAKELEKQGFNFSIGTGQVNKVHFNRLGWAADISRGFDVCANVLAAAEIYNDCHSRAVKAGYSPVASSVEFKANLIVESKGYSSVHAALSCYYSGDFQRGNRLGYVSKVLQVKSMPGDAPKTGARVGGTFSMMVD